MRKPVPDWIFVPQLSGEVRHRAKWRELAAEEEGTVLTVLRELAAVPICWP